jgi:hypothetical protein
MRLGDVSRAPDGVLAVEAQRCKVFGNGLPNRFSQNIRIFVTQPIAKTAYLIPRLIRRQFLRE